MLRPHSLVAALASVLLLLSPGATGGQEAVRVVTGGLLFPLQVSFFGNGFALVSEAGAGLFDLHRDRDR